MKQLLKRTYQGVPFKKEIFFLLRAFPVPFGIYRHLYFQGKFSVMSKGGTFQIMHHGSHIENTIFWKGLKGCWESESIALWEELVRDASVIFDIGANSGVYSLIAKTNSPEARVVAFEPIQRVFEKLVQNTGLNGYDIQTENKAVSNFTGTSTIYDTPGMHSVSASMNYDFVKARTDIIETSVQVTTVDEYMTEQDIDRLDLMKIDVEKHEVSVIEGAIQTIRQHRPKILIEVLDQEVGDALDGLFRPLDYAYFQITKTGTVPVDRISSPHNRNLLLAPKHK